MAEQLELLNERMHLMEMVNDAGIDCVMVFDTNLSAIYCNNASEKITGIKKEDAPGNSFYELFPDFKGNKNIENALNQVLKGRKAFVPQEKAAYPGGGYYEHHFVPLKGDDKTIVIGVLNIVYDVEHRVQVEKELKSLNKSLAWKNKELKNTNAELLAFSRIISIRLKDPVQSLYTFMERLLDNKANNVCEQDRAGIKRMQTSIQQMRLLIDDISACSGLGDQHHAFTNVDLNHVLLFTVSNMQDEIELRSATVESDELPVIVGCKPLLVQMFQSIISNSIKFQEEGKNAKIKIEAAKVQGAELPYSEASAEMHYIRLSFYDNGVGFYPKKLDQLFQMFYRGGSRSYPGEGIGLAICKKIAELHHGFISAENNESRGSVIYVFLPVAKKWQLQK